MDKNKLIPFGVLVILVIVVGILLYINNKNSLSFSELVISYNNENTTHSNLDLDNVIVVNNVSFWIVSKTKNELVFHTNENVYLNNEETEEILLSVNKNNEVCFADSTCSLFILQ